MKKIRIFFVLIFITMYLDAAPPKTNHTAMAAGGFVGAGVGHLVEKKFDSSAKLRQEKLDLVLQIKEEILKRKGLNNNLSWLSSDKIKALVEELEAETLVQEMMAHGESEAMMYGNMQTQKRKAAAGLILIGSVAAALKILGTSNEATAWLSAIVAIPTLVSSYKKYKSASRNQKKINFLQQAQGTYLGLSADEHGNYENAYIADPAAKEVATDLEKLELLETMLEEDVSQYSGDVSRYENLKNLARATKFLSILFSFRHIFDMFMACSTDWTKGGPREPKFFPGEAEGEEESPEDAILRIKEEEEENKKKLKRLSLKIGLGKEQMKKNEERLAELKRRDKGKIRRRLNLPECSFIGDQMPEEFKTALERLGEWENLHQQIINHSKMTQNEKDEAIAECHEGFNDAVAIAMASRPAMRQKEGCESDLKFPDELLTFQRSELFNRKLVIQRLNARARQKQVHL